MNNELYRDFIDRELTVIDDHLVDIINLLGNVVVLENATGNPVSFNTSLTMPLVQCKSLISGYQEGTGTPSPSNIRNIVSFSEGIITVNNDTYTFTFGQTVYTGELDVLTGVLTVTHKLAIFDGSENWRKDGDNGRYLIPNWVAENSIISNIDHYQNLCPTATTWAGLNNSNNACYFASSLIYKVNNSLYPTVEDFKNFLSQNNLQVMYPLATPIEVQLTPTTQIKSIIGLNSIASNTGDLDVKFLALATD